MRCSSTAAFPSRPTYFMPPTKSLAREAFALVQHVHLAGRDDEVVGPDRVGPPRADPSVHVRDAHVVEQPHGRGVVEMTLRVEVVVARRDRLDDAVAVGRRARARRRRRCSRPHERAAVGHERVTGEVTAGVGAQEPRDRSDVELGIALALHRTVLDEDAIALALLRGFAVMRRRGGRDRVHDDPVGAPLARRGARDRADRFLRRVVRARIRCRR